MCVSLCFLQSTKKETLKDDMEEADIKVEQSRDSLATEMFKLLAMENDFSQSILQLLKLQRGYHESALKILEIVIPELEKNIGDSAVKRVFGIPLGEHLRVTGKRLAYPLEICVTVLSEYGMAEEGLFRIVGGMSKVKRLKQSLDSGCFSNLIPEYRDVHVLASTMKLYLRELPEPLLTFSLHHEWMNSMAYPENQRLDVVRGILARLPRENRENLAYLIQFLAKLQQYPENKMSSSSVAIVMAPNLLWHKNDEDNMNMGNCATINMLLEFFLKEVDMLFPDDVSKLVKLPDIIREIESQRVFYNHRNNGENDDIHIETHSPKPNLRKKKPAAPVPPNNVSKTDQDLVEEKSTVGANYLSGSSTLNRPQKAREAVKTKTTTAMNTEENSLSWSRTHTVVEKPKVEKLVNLDDKSGTGDDEETINHAQCNDKCFTTTAVHQVTNHVERPVAAPRQSICDGGERVASVTRTSSIKCDMSKSLNESDVAFKKPQIPARPASLQKRASTDNLDANLQKTQCSLYSVANRQQPSIVNLNNRIEKFLPGHDNQIAEKERFLGHQPEKMVPMPRTSLENKLNDINLNSERHSIAGMKPDLPPKVQQAGKTSEKSKMSKSNEKIDLCEEFMNGGKQRSHVRTRSDGNIVELGADSPPTSLVQTPPSPRSLSKPTQPPPPPPNKAKSPDWPTTNL